MDRKIYQAQGSYGLFLKPEFFWHFVGYSHIMIERKKLRFLLHAQSRN